MAEFSEQEKRNLSFKHVLGIAGTNNLDGANGRQWYEETIASTHPVYLPTARADFIPQAGSLSTAQANATSFDSVEDRSQGESITLSSNGSDWDITTSTIVPQLGYQVTDVHPSPSYIKSIVAVIDNGGGNYTITLNDNSGVSAGSAVLHSRIYLTKDPTSNQKSWQAKTVQSDFFSSRVRDFLSPIDFGKGYNVNLYQNDGTAIQLTEGAWFFNWAEGLLIFADGFTAQDLGYTEPLYIEAFRYNGQLGASGAAIDVFKEGSPAVNDATILDFGEGLSVSGNGSTAVITLTGVFSNVLDGINIGDTLRWTGSEWEPTDDLTISGGDVFVEDRLTIEGSIVIPSGMRPADTSSPGTEGEVRFDYNYVYFHTGLGGWRRTELACFGPSPGPVPPSSSATFLGLLGVVQCPITSGTNLDVDQDPVPIDSSTINVPGGVFTVTSSGIQVSDEGIYKVTWNVEGERNGGSTQRRILTTNLAIDGVDVPNSFSNGYFRDGTNNTGNSQNSILVEITAENQTISIKSAQTGSGDSSMSSTFLSKGGHLLIEYIGVN